MKLSSVALISTLAPLIAAKNVFPLVRRFDNETTTGLDTSSTALLGSSSAGVTTLQPSVQSVPSTTGQLTTTAPQPQSQISPVTPQTTGAIQSTQQNTFETTQEARVTTILNPSDDYTITSTIFYYVTITGQTPSASPTFTPTPTEGDVTSTLINYVTSTLQPQTTTLTGVDGNLITAVLKGKVVTGVTDHQGSFSAVQATSTPYATTVTVTDYTTTDYVTVTDTTTVTAAYTSTSSSSTPIVSVLSPTVTPFYGNGTLH